ncbi:diguanylate cyclase/phosphodiesterase (GGDEF & EAL domains) with PAS/PAC sensor(s) [hydrothermal vent metagenome]|uniref:Diguanylate cyclase/phosphodiesterase (GGDEF & EAL domains) with PAS/PAC sensor(S) n=1 Tax=hydrothermal vent metagenome TaxID=652676 RepID=A0A3B0V9Z1_9ZZZZ
MLATMTYDNPSPEINLNSLVVELEHYRRQSEWLGLVNDLHARLSGAVDLPTMLEAFSVWLTPLVEHELMAYENQERNRVHMLCSCHGPDRRQIIEIARKSLKLQTDIAGSYCGLHGNFHLHRWNLDKFKASGIMLVLKKDKKISQYEEGLLNKGLEILSEPLQRALEYEDLYEQASHDTLTGLLNRRVFEERITSIMAQSHRHGHPVTLACLDLDKFKEINDTHGHAVGDMVLQKMAMIMENMVRSCDILARVGGDEFVIILPETELADAQTLANRLCRAIDQFELPALGSSKLGISIGLAELEPGQTQEKWQQRADEALYQAKAAGRSQVHCL